MKRAILVLAFVLGAASADARPVDETRMSPTERGYIYKPEAKQTVGTLIAVALGFGIGLIVIALAMRKPERYTSEPPPS